MGTENKGIKPQAEKKSKNGKPAKKELRQTLTTYEQSLINYLVQKKEAMNNVPGGLQRVRRLMLGINNRNLEDPLYTVQIGMFEVSFHILTGMKDRGTLFGLERYIMDWYRQMDIVKNLEYMAHNMEKE